MSRRQHAQEAPPRNYHETVMPFTKGNKLSPGGKKGNKGGRPTKEAAEVKKALIDKYWVEVEKHLDSVMAKYFKAKDAPRDVINRAVPYAKTEIEHSGEVGVRPWIVDAYEPKKKK